MESTIVIRNLTQRKVFLQNKIASIGIDVTYYNVFNKDARKVRREPDRYVIVFTESIELRKELKTFLQKEGIICISGIKEYQYGSRSVDKNKKVPFGFSDIDSDTIPVWSLKIDLESLKI